MELTRNFGWVCFPSRTDGELFIPAGFIIHMWAKPILCELCEWLKWVLASQKSLGLVVCYGWKQKLRPNLLRRRSNSWGTRGVF